MKKPVAIPTQQNPKPTNDEAQTRAPRAFTPNQSATPVESFEEPISEPTILNQNTSRPNWALRVSLSAGGLLISLAIGLAAEGLVRDLFLRYEWLGWIGFTILATLILAALIFTLKEFNAIARLRTLDDLRIAAASALANDDEPAARTLLAKLQALYANRPDLARARSQLDEDTRDFIDGVQIIKTAEHALMAPLDARAKALTAASARRVAIVTAISPRALVDIAFVAYESFKLARSIAELYGAGPSLLGTWRLAGSILGQLAITGGVTLGDSLVQQLVGHGLAAKLSARLGEGLINGLMTVRVGIAAMRVTRPIQFTALKQPMVMDFMADLANIAKSADQKTNV